MPSEKAIQIITDRDGKWRRRRIKVVHAQTATHSPESNSDMPLLEASGQATVNNLHE